MANLFPEPPKFGIPLSRGGDIYLEFTLTVPELDDDGEPVIVNGKIKKVEVDFPPGSSLTFAIAVGDLDTDGDIEEVKQLAEINGSKAKMLMDHIEVDVLSHDQNRLWRLTYTSADGVDSPVANGWTYRADGEEDDD